MRPTCPDSRPTFIDTGELDIFRDECVEYARRIAATGTSVELHVHPGCPHGFDRMPIPVAERAIADRVRVLQPPLGQHRLDGLDRVGVGRGLVVAVPADASEPQRDAARVAARRLHAVERDLDDELGAHVHGDPVAADLAREQFLRSATRAARR